MTRMARHLFVATLFACLMAVATVAHAASLLSLNKAYAYTAGTLPGQAPNHYFDDVGGHPSTIGTFGLGELTDGVVSPGAPVGGANQPVVGIRGGGGGSAPAADIVFDLGGIFDIENIVIGTAVGAAANNNAPDDVSISFSTVSATGPFSTPEFFDLESLYGPIADGHFDMLVDVTDGQAQFVKLSFDGGSMAEPGGSDPNEKWILDEVSIFGSELAVPEPASIAIWSLLGAAIFIAWRHRRKFR